MIEYTTAAAPAEASYTEKRSEFIAQLFPVTEAMESLRLIDGVKAKHHKARHNVWAYRLRSGDISRYSDDGEPQGTGGIPVLSVLQKAELTDICVVVTRYFGGVLLGTGGLSRAYAGAAKEALLDAGFRLVAEWTPVRFSCPYPLLERCKGSVAALGGEIGQLEYGEDVRILALLPVDEAEKLVSSLTELSGGSIHPEIEESIRK